MDVNEIRMLNLTTLVHEAGSKRRLAQRAGIGPGYLSQVDQSAHKASSASSKPRYIGSKVCRKLEVAQGKERGWMDQLHDATELVKKGLPSRRVAIIDWSEAVKMKSMSPEEYLSKPSTVYVGQYEGGRMFALQVLDDSMVNAHSPFSFPEGCWIICDPAGTAKAKSYVIIRLPNSANCIFRQLVDDGGRLRMKALNIGYAPHEYLPEGAEIMAVVVKMMQDIPLE